MSDVADGREGKFRLAVTGDLHCREDQHKQFREMIRAVNAEADALLLCGDLTDRGLSEEAKALGEALSALTVPCAVVLGNHDFEGSARDVTKILHDVGVHVLDGDHVVFDSYLGVAGVKGFGGGFGNGMLQAFGESVIKAYVQEAVNESLKLEAALGQLDTPKKVVIMHYAPIPDTVRGERVEIHTYLGTSRLAAPVDLYDADMVFHGHAHHGTLEGKTPKGIPVFNVSIPVLRREKDRAFLLLTI